MPRHNNTLTIRLNFNTKMLKILNYVTFRGRKKILTGTGEKSAALNTVI